MEKRLPYAVLLLRIALALTLISVLADKAGLWGEPGTPAVIWGEWNNYEKYVQLLLSLLPAGITDKLAVVFTITEVVLALMLLAGIKVRWAAIGMSIYTLLLAVLTILSFGIKTTLNYSLLVTFAASVLLACCPIYRFSLHGVKKRSTFHPY